MRGRAAASLVSSPAHGRHSAVILPLRAREKSTAVTFDDVSLAEQRKAAIAAARARQGQGVGRPGERKEEMAEAAAKVEGGKSTWQKFMSGLVNIVRPVAALAYPVVMPILDAPSQRRVAQAVVYGYMAGGADDERALRRSVAAYNDVELRHAVLHGVGNSDMDLRTTILGEEAKLPFFITSCAGQRMFHADGEVATAKTAKKNTGCTWPSRS